MQKNKTTISSLIFLVLLVTHALINNNYGYQASVFVPTAVLLTINALLLLFANSIVLRKFILLPGLGFWLAFLWFSPGLFYFLADSDEVMGLRILYWIEYLLMIIFLLKTNALLEEQAEKGQANRD